MYTATHLNKISKNILTKNFSHFIAGIIDNLYLRISLKIVLMVYSGGNWFVKKKNLKLKISCQTPFKSPYLVEAGCEAGLLGGRKDERLVVALQHLVGHALKVPGALAHPLRPDGHLHHVVLAYRLQQHLGYLHHVVLANRLQQHVGYLHHANRLQQHVGYLHHVILAYRLQQYVGYLHHVILANRLQQHVGYLHHANRLQQHVGYLHHVILANRL